MPRSQAEALLAKSDLKVRVRTRRAASVPPDLVLDQEPQANEVVARGCPVELLVAEPEPLVRVPDLHGLSEKEALSRLSTLGLTRGRIEGSGTGGKVVKQDPEPQAPIARGSPVHVWIRPDSRPQPDLVPVPDVAGRELKAAADMVRRAGLSPVFQGKGACVGRQSPSARARVRPGSPVTLYAGTCPVR
jgi:beta-lactam-binding protein with PASTA domain